MYTFVLLRICSKLGDVDWPCNFMAALGGKHFLKNVKKRKIFFFKVQKLLFIAVFIFTVDFRLFIINEYYLH